jgi:hypothetical protein
VNHGDRRKDLRRGQVRGVLEGRLGVPVPLSYCSVPVSLVRTISIAQADNRLYSSSLPSWNFWSARSLLGS